MIEKGKISAFQMGVIMYPTIVTTALLLVPTATAAAAHRDFWISPIWASLNGLFTVFVTVRLSKYYPEKTLIEYVEQIVGRFLGKVLGLVLLLFFLHQCGFIIREYGEFVVGAFLNRTPLSVIMGTMILVCVMNVRGGLEVIGRSAQMLVPIVLFLFVWIVILLIPDLDPNNMLPVMESGLGPSLMGSLVPLGWFGEFFLIAIMLPYVADRQKGMKWGMISVLTVMLTMVITNFASLFLFGDSTTTYIYPVMVAARYISIADFFQHLEAVVMAIWVMGMFVKISMFFYALVLGTAQWLKLSDYRPITLPIGFIVLVFGIWVAPNLQEMVQFISTVSPFYFLSIQTAIPTLLLIIVWIRKMFQHPKGVQAG
jgi:spore germination protein KB